MQKGSQEAKGLLDLAKERSSEGLERTKEGWQDIKESVKFAAGVLSNFLACMRSPTQACGPQPRHAVPQIMHAVPKPCMRSLTQACGPQPRHAVPKPCMHS